MKCPKGAEPESTQNSVIVVTKEGSRVTFLAKEGRDGGIPDFDSMTDTEDRTAAGRDRAARIPNGTLSEGPWSAVIATSPSPLVTEGRLLTPLVLQENREISASLF